MALLGSFVIHGNDRGTLEEALRGLRPVSDHLVTVDSASTDGSRNIASRYADRVDVLPWQGYGAARARAWTLLAAAGVEWMFFLDADERLPDGQGEALLAALRSGALSGNAYRVGCRNLDLSGPRPYVFYTHHRVRLLRASHNPWRREQIVHEAFPRGRYPRLDVHIDHRFLVDGAARRQKEHRYALLWAIQHATSRWPAPPGLAWLAQVSRDLVGRGAILRGGRQAVRSACLLADYARLKHRYLREVHRGEHAELVTLYRRGELLELFRRVQGVPFPRPLTVE